MNEYDKALDKVYKTLVIDLVETAYQAESCLEKYVTILDYPVGIYCKSQIEPILIDSVKYRMMTKAGMVDYYLGQEIKGPIYQEINGQMKLIVSSHLVNNQTTMLNDKPILPYHGVKIGLTELNSYCSSLVSYSRLGSLSNSDNVPYAGFIRDLDKDKYLDVVDDMDDIFRESKALIRDFIKGYEDHLVYCYLNAGKMKIDIGIDNRALKWITQETEKRRDIEAYENI